MKFVRLLGALFVFGVVVQGCSSGRVGGDTASGEEASLGEVSQAITTACSFDTLGLPCDPDGPANPTYQECEGTCAIGALGLVSCLRVAAGTMDGIVCGNAAGVGNSACAQHCSGRTCLGTPAAAGAACRPNSGATPCEGQCDGAAHCDPVAAPCDFGRDQQLCKFATCNFANATECVNGNVRAGVQCSLSDACSLGKCNSTGTCVATAVVGCDDGNACTDDVCDKDTGGCIGKVDDTNNCSDSDACTIDDFCLGGVCHAGTTPKGCDDGNACTADSCDPNTGCAHVAKSCDDGDACTDDACNPSTGACSHQTKACDDSDLCTSDTCSSATGCVFTPLNCDDLDACTEDSCFGGSCVNTPQSCDDGDDCTLDSCDSVSGCMNAAIDSEACVPIGDGGAAGMPSAGGAPMGDAGAPTGDAGAAPVEGGAPGVGAAGEPSGTAGNAGAMATGGNPSAGNAGTAGNAETGGTSSSGAASADGGAGETTTPSSRAVQDSGCGCKVPAAPQRGGAGWALGLAALVALSRRRRAA